MAALSPGASRWRPAAVAGIRDAGPAAMADVDQPAGARRTSRARGRFRTVRVASPRGPVLKGSKDVLRAPGAGPGDHDDRGAH
jgi:hypothetical protein